MARHRFTILGCGASPGVPRINGDWGACDPAEPRNRRLRCSVMIERWHSDGGPPTRVVIDTGPDFREQMLRARAESIDGVVYSHSHADHVHGIDDLRQYWMTLRRPITIYSDDTTQQRLDEGFGYCFAAPEGSPYPPFLLRRRIAAVDRFTVTGPGGPIAIEPLDQEHGESRSLGFRIGPVAYSCDFNDLPPETARRLAGIETWVLGALRPKPHPSHCSVDEAKAWVARIAPRRAIFTHMTADLDYATLSRDLPPGVEPAYDGLAFEFDVEVAQRAPERQTASPGE
jgi:phosphoribosyl 1,2-cyclic phosphate phosphodiesterase